MPKFPTDIYTEPSPLDGNTLANLGPLRRMAGLWRGEKGVDVKPKAQGPKTQVYVEHYELQPIDPQTNGLQVLYGLRYHTYIHKPGLTKMYHDQVGYWLWEPATSTVMHTLAIPRGQVAMASGQVAADADSFELVATHGSLVNGIVSNPFIEHAFTTLEWRIGVAFHADGSWSYDQDTVMQIQGLAEPFHHTDRNRLSKIGEPSPNPLALAEE
ncbi:FABP family protein [Variovorax saccharolyticus]|uniref:FABP family protein n=1 Tax=Variovorax saccharolyticus TaxID=3053516 RepID=UPI0025790298|nr:heme-binding beta-barrel domain-containing protein [Variovorax sp. J22R187]MDM0016605.1 heme-binding beta-barrel domain-containing protein [Variovorax sp. J22R187]